MSRLLDIGLEELSTMLLKMGEAAEKSVKTAIDGFLKGLDVNNEVHLLSEMLNIMSVDVEDKVFELIAKYQPVASDLRIIKSYMKIAYDLERYGRYAWDISFAHKVLNKSQKCGHPHVPMEGLTEKVAKMVHTSIRALRNYDVNLAKTLGQPEKEVDKIYLEYLDHLSKVPPTTQCAACDILVVRYLERIADHSAYVGESIIYIVTGEKLLIR